MSDITVTAASDIEVDREQLDASIGEFAGQNGEYYANAFHKIHEAAGTPALTFNLAATVLGPVWAAMRGAWGFFWAFLILEVIAWVQIGRGWWGDPGAHYTERATSQLARATQFLERAADAKEAGEDPARFETLAANMAKAAERSQGQADAANAEALTILITGLVLLVTFKLVQGFYANIVYEKQYSRWRISPS